MYISHKHKMLSFSTCIVKFQLYGQWSVWLFFPDVMENQQEGHSPGTLTLSSHHMVDI